MKRIASIILSGAMLVTTFVGASTTANATSTFCETDDNGYKFNTYHDGTAEIIGYDGSETEIVIPDTINNCTVTSICYSAFADNTTITSVTIPETVTFIDLNAFYGCTNLADITIPDSVEHINCRFDSTAYYNDDNNWEDGALYIGNHLVDTNDTIANEYKIKEGTVTVSSSAFKSCTNIVDITIPKSVRSIDCSLEDTALYYDDSKWEDGALYIDNHLVATNENIAEDYKIKDGTISISGSALSLGDIKKVTIPASVSAINKDTLFSFRTTLKEITVAEENEYYHSIDGVLIDSKTNTLLKYPAAKILENYKIPEGVKRIYEPAFYACTLKSITLPSSVQKIIRIDHNFYSPWYTCFSEEINVSEDSEYFYSKDGILFDKQSNILVKYPSMKSDTEYTIPDGVTGIYKYAFYETGLKNITIPESVEIIGGCAFALNNDLKKVTILNPDCTIYLSAFPQSKGVKIYGHKYSTAEGLAESKDFKFVSLDKANDKTDNATGFSAVINTLDSPSVKILLVVVLILLILLLIIKRLGNKKRNDKKMINAETNTAINNNINTEITLDSLNL